jgi:DNA-directed RNA polymerase specialized sigma24 family protein
MMMDVFDEPLTSALQTTDPGDPDPGGGADPRPAASAAARDHAEQLAALARHLPPADRDIVLAVYECGLSVAALARAAGRDPRVLRGRLRRLALRLASAPFRFVLAHQHEWPARRRRVAALIVLHGHSERATAARLGLSLHHVRREIDRVRALVEQDALAHRAARRRAGPFESDDDDMDVDMVRGGLMPAPGGRS